MPFEDVEVVVGSEDVMKVSQCREEEDETRT
jgi:hypothetical protein